LGARPQTVSRLHNKQVPFTLAHSAAALPFCRSPLIPSALIIGTMAPDFEYFLRLSPSIGYGHTLTGAIVLTLPLGTLVLWLFQISVKPLAVSLMPRGLQSRLIDFPVPFRFFGGARFSIILLSLLLGIATHLAWDSFTHAHSWLTQHWSFLRELSTLPIVGPVPHYKILQHLSTLLGLAALCTWFAHWYGETPPSPVPPQPALRRFSASRKLFIITQIAVISAAGSFVRVIARLETLAHPTPESIAGQAICTFIAIAWWQLVAYGLISRNRQRFLQKRPL
jgi:hypothetical protein